MADENLKQLIEECLRNFERDPKLKVCEVKVNKGSKEGDNYMSVVNCVEVYGQWGNGAAYSRSLFLKKPPSDLERCELFDIDKAFENESVMYKDYFSKVVEFNIPIAKCVHADRYVIILENLKESGYRMCNRKESLDLAHCRLSIQALAKFHSSSYFLKITKNNELDELMSKITCFALVGPLYSRMIEDAISSCLKVLSKYKDDSAIADVIPKIEKLVSSGLETMVSLTKSDKLAVLCHGDFWINNLLFRYDEQNFVSALKIIDFQAPRLQSFAVDLWTFIYTSIKPSLLENCLEDLVRLYFNTFVSSIDGKVPESTIPKYKDVINELYKKQLYGFLVTMWYLPTLFIDSSTVSDIDDMMSQYSHSESNITDIVELPKDYDNRVLTIVRHCDSRGVFDML